MHNEEAVAVALGRHRGAAREWRGRRVSVFFFPGIFVTVCDALS